MIKVKYIISALILVSLVSFILLFVFYNGFLNSSVAQEFNLQVESGETKTEILNAIGEELDLSSIQILYSKFYLFLNKEIQFDAGNYSFENSITYEELLNSIRGGQEDQVELKFLEGWRVEQNVMELYKKVGHEFAKEYYELAKDKIGYLFPDTYFADSNTTPSSLLDKQLNIFEEKTHPLLNSYESGFSDEEIVTLASLVEREVRNDDQRSIVAGIIIKRYLEGLTLDIDATTQYGIYNNSSSKDFFESCITENRDICTTARFKSMEFWPKEITQSDLESDNPYNTRGKSSLPPTPISNPSLSSIEAVLNPESTSYYYYLHDEEGNIHYAVTNEEHVENIRRYLYN